MANSHIILEATYLCMGLCCPETVATTLERLQTMGLTYTAIEQTGLKKRVRELKHDAVHGRMASKVLKAWKHDDLASTARRTCSTSSSSSGYNSASTSDSAEARSAPTTNKGTKRKLSIGDERPERIIGEPTKDWASFRIPKKTSGAETKQEPATKSASSLEKTSMKTTTWTVTKTVTTWGNAQKKRKEEEKKTKPRVSGGVKTDVKIEKRQSMNRKEIPSLLNFETVNRKELPSILTMPNPFLPQ